MSVERFDYVVVGAGSSGAVIASRLTEDPAVSVLVIEAGGQDSHPYIHLPVGFPKASMMPTLNWGYESEPEPELNGRKLPLPRGKVLGGSSSINGMFYMRGHPLDYDEWRDQGCTGWGHAELLPYFRKLEHNWRGDNAVHGSGGPVSVSAIKSYRDTYELLSNTAQNLGYQAPADIDEAPYEGFVRGDATIDAKGRRSSAYRAYLHPVRQRPNLSISTRSQATRVVMENGKVTGLEYLKDGRQHLAQVNREVILSGGAYNSPQLLMLSGIGDREHLQSHGLDCCVELPGVGRNLQEHARIMLEYAAKPSRAFNQELRFDKAVTSVLRWGLLGTGPFASQINSCNMVFKTRPELARADIQIFGNPVRLDANLWFPGLVKGKPPSFYLTICLLRPLSQGRVELRSADPLAKPKIHLGLFSNPADFTPLCEAIRMARRLYGSEPQSLYTGAEFNPGADVSSDEQLTAFIRQMAGVTHHPVGTCKMGTCPDAVVDPQLRVYGVSGLRVADASIMPSIPGGNTNIPAIMIGEKAADLIQHAARAAVQSSELRATV